MLELLRGGGLPDVFVIAFVHRLRVGLRLGPRTRPVALIASLRAMKKSTMSGSVGAPGRGSLLKIKCIAVLILQEFIRMFDLMWLPLLRQAFPLLLSLLI